MKNEKLYLKTRKKMKFSFFNLKVKKEKFTFGNHKVRKECLEEKLEIV